MKPCNETKSRDLRLAYRLTPLGLACTVLLVPGVPVGKTGILLADQPAEGAQSSRPGDLRVSPTVPAASTRLVLHVSPPSAERLRVNSRPLLPLPGEKPAEASPAARRRMVGPPVPERHAVRNGENAWEIARQQGVDMRTLQKLNPGTDWRRLQIGQTIAVAEPTVPGDATVLAVSRSTGQASVVAKPLVRTAEGGDFLRQSGVRLAQAEGAAPAVGPTENLLLQPGQSRVLEFRGIKRAVVGDPAVADVVPVSANELIVTPKGVGETTLFVWDNAGRRSYRVVVGGPAAPDLTQEAGKLQDFIGDPNVRVRVLGDTLFLEGTVRSEAASQRAEAMATAVAKNVRNLIVVDAPPPPPAPVPAPPPAVADVAARTLTQALTNTGVTARAVSPTMVLVEGTVPPMEAERVRKILGAIDRSVTLVDALQVVQPAARQVLIRARVVDINRAKIKDLGVDWGQVVSGRGGNQRSIASQPFLFGIFGKLFQGDIDANPLDPFGARLNLLIQENAARILSEPNILVLEGARGSILVGGEFPVPVVQNAVGGLGSVSVEFKEFGVRLGVEPLAVDADNITLRVQPEVSLLDFANGVQISGFNLPALRTRREESTVRIVNGQTLAIGGLIENTYTQNVRRIPLLSKIPVLGELFKSRSWQRNETELVILLTPELVAPGTSPAVTPLGEIGPRYPIRSPVQDVQDAKREIDRQLDRKNR